jgi:hypothetical protein
MVQAKRLFGGIALNTDWQSIKTNGPGISSSNRHMSLTVGPSLAISTVNLSTSNIWMSTDGGVNWSTKSLPTAGIYGLSLYTGDRYILMKNFSNAAGSSYYSTDGNVWTPATLAVSATWLDATVGSSKDRLVAVGSTTNTVMYSANQGSSWSQASNIYAPRSVTYDPNYNWYITVGNHAYAGKTVAANVGSGWSSGGIMPVDTLWVGVTYANGKLVAIPASGAHAAISTDGGVSWSGTTLPVSSSWRKVLYRSGRFWITPASDSGPVLSSEDGLSWTNHGTMSITLIDGSGDVLLGIGETGTAPFARRILGKSPVGQGNIIPSDCIMTSISLANRSAERAFAVADLDGVCILRGVYIDPMSTKNIPIKCRLAEGSDLKVYSNKMTSYSAYGVEL